MFSRKRCYFFVCPKNNFLERVFLGRKIIAPQVRRFILVTLGTLQSGFFFVEQPVDFFDELQQLIRVFLDYGSLTHFAPRLFCLSLHGPRNLVFGTYYARLAAG
jgi:hypothetical protein